MHVLLFFIEAATCVGVPNTDVKKRLQHRCFPLNSAKIFRKSIWKNTCKQLSVFFTKIHSKQLSTYKVGS